MATPPTRVASVVPASGNYTTTTSPKVSAALPALQVGDVIVVLAGSEQAGTNATVTPTASAGSVTWTLQREQMTGTTNQSGEKLWTGIVGAAAAAGATISLARINTSTTLWWGFSATVWRGHGGVGQSWVGSSGTSNSVAQLTTPALAANSAVQVGINDWNASTIATPSWQVINGTAMQTGLNVTGASHATAIGGYHTDVGAAGTEVVGLTTPATLRWVMVGVEILGAAAGGTNQALAGTVAGTSAAAGSLTARVALAGTVAAVSAVAGSIGVAQGLGGTVPATSTTAGAITADHPLGGTVAATTATTGTPTADHPLAGSSSATSAVSGSLGTQQSLTGTVAATSATAGSITLRAPLAGSVTATSTTNGAPSSRQGIAATVNAVSSTAGTFFEAGPQVYPLVGNVTATTTTAGSIAARHPLSGTVAAASTAAGSISRAAALAGTVTGTTVVLGGVTANVTLSGQVAATSGTAGAFVQPTSEFTGRILRVTVAAPTALGVIVLPASTGDLVSQRVTGRLSTLRARGVIT